uniref:Uncharacterized protein n=1 Tax=Arundo donax TaxID=35708 RepID=A0A0A9FM19_ARUDO
MLSICPTLSAAPLIRHRARATRSAFWSDKNGERADLWPSASTGMPYTTLRADS